MIASGHLGKAVGRISSNGVADVEDPNIMQQLNEKFPSKEHSLPSSVPKVSAIDSFTDLRETLLALEPSTSPGSGGCRPEFLTALGDAMETEEIAILEEFGLAYLAGEMPAWFYQLWLSLSTVPLYKDDDLIDVRPLGVRHPLIRVFHREVARQSKEEVREVLEPQQLEQSRALTQPMGTHG